MAGLTLRDRISARRVADSMTSPASILAGGGGLAAGTAIGLSLPLVLALGVVGCGIGVGAAALSRSGPGTQAPSPAHQIDPSGLQEPWWAHVRAALLSQSNVRERVNSIQPGPLRDNLQEISRRVDAAVVEAWQVAERGQALTEARKAIDTRAIDRKLRDLENRLSKEPDEERLQQALEAARGQQAVADRMDEVIDDTDTQLRWLDAQIGEVVVRAVELSTHTGDVSLGDLSSDVDSLVGEMEALRLALDETRGMTDDLPDDAD